MKKTLKKSEMKKLFNIAQELIPGMESRDDFSRHFSDDEDFMDVAVWCLEKALVSAYQLGKATAEIEADKKAAAAAKAE